jgi:hypothetical protein
MEFEKEFCDVDEQIVSLAFVDGYPNLTIVKKNPNKLSEG